MPVVLRPFSGPAIGYYATQQQLAQVCFPSNLAIWSQGDPRKINPDESTPPDISQIQAALTYADSRINNEFRGSRFVTPLVFSAGVSVGPNFIDPEINRGACVIAREWLYCGARGYLEMDPSAQRFKKEMEEFYGQCLLYKAGALFLSAQINPGCGTGPRVIVNL